MKGNYGKRKDGSIIRTQRECVLYYLQEKPGRVITSWLAIKEFGFTRLSAIVFDIEHKEGIRLSRHTATSKNRYGASISYSVYYLPKK